MQAAYAQLDDDSLIALVVQAQPDALGALYDRYSRLVYSVALHITNDPPLAEEITQDVFLRVWERAASFQPGQGRLGSWLAGIARHRAIDVFRHNQTDARGHSLAWDDLPHFDPPDEHNVEQAVDSAQQQQRIHRALSALPEEQRQALALAFFRGYTHDEVAAALGEPLGTVKTRIRLAMQKLRKLLEEEKLSAG